MKVCQDRLGIMVERAFFSLYSFSVGHSNPVATPSSHSVIPARLRLDRDGLEDFWRAWLERRHLRRRINAAERTKVSSARRESSHALA